MDRFTLAEFAKNSENKEGESFTPSVQESGIEQGSLIVSSLYNTMLGEITKTLKSWDAELLKVLTEADIVPSDLSTEQLFTAITRLIAKTHGRNIGDVYYSQSGSSADNPGALPLFTGESVANVSNVYPQFYAWLVAHPSLCISSSAYDQRIAQYGECPFYVLDVANNTVRLPKLVNYVKMANTTDGVTQAGAGLPNITGSTTAINVGNYNNGGGNGALLQQPYSSGNSGVRDGAGQRGNIFDFDASRSNSIYGNSNTVTPANTTLFPWLVVFNTAVPASSAQAAEFQQALTGKADVGLGNVTSQAGVSLNTAGVRTVVETYQNGDSWYRKWSDGYCEQGGVFASGGDTTLTLTLLVPYASTNYQVWYCGCGTNTNTGGASWINQMFYPETNSTAIYRRINYTRWWRAAGYTI